MNRRTWISRIFVTFILILSVGNLPAHAGTFAAFGTKTFVRDYGKPFTETVTFNAKNQNTAFTMQIYNGGTAGEYERVSSAIVILNGHEVFGPDAYNQNVSYLEKPVSLKAVNELSVEVRGKPNGTIVINIIGIDNDFPTITSTLSPLPKVSGWNNTDATVTFDCDDATSGISFCQAPVIVNTEGGSQVITGKAIDNAGNTASTSATVNLDKTPPVLKITSPQDGSTVKSSKPGVAIEYSDAFSGIDFTTARLSVDGLDVTGNAVITDKAISYTPDAAVKDGTHTIAVSVSDKAGNTTDASISFTTKTKQRPFIFPEPGFESGSYRGIGRIYTDSIKVSDVNKDGIIDIAVINHYDWDNDKSKISVLLGKGDGGFEKPISFAEKLGYYDSNSITDIAFGDFDGNGYPDLAVAISSPHRVEIFLGKGDGTFVQGMAYNIDNPKSWIGMKVLTGNFDGDGHEDVAVSDSSGGMHFLYGNGNGTFSAPTKLQIVVAPYVAALDAIASDFNKDGITDMAVTVQEWNSGISTPVSKVYMLLGSGNGTFRPSELLSMEDERFLVGLAEEDFDRDGNIDILVSTSGQGDYPFGLTILMGDGNGGFSRKLDHNINLGVNYLARVKDINGDKTADIVLIGYHKAYVFLGRGDGTFKDPMEFNVSGDELNIGDFDGDGAEDIVTATLDHVFVVFAKGDGTFIDRKEIVTTTQSPFISSADFDGDHTPDIARAGGGYYEGLLFSTITNKGGYWSEDIFKGEEKYNVGSGPVSVKMGDLNGDGHPDIVTANELSGDVTVLLNNGDGRLKAPVSYKVGKKPNSIAVEDLNMDGKMDIVVVNNGSYDISVLMGRGDGSFQDQRSYAAAVQHPRPLAVGDYNGDGKPDIALANSDWSASTISILLGNGDGTFQPGKVQNIRGSHPNVLAKGDFNQDGILDLVLLHISLDVMWNPAAMNLLIGKGDGTFVNHIIRTGIFSDLEVSDFNKDGKLDILLIGNGATILLGDGNGGFEQIQQFGDVMGCKAAALGDINNDGELDVLFGDSSRSTYDNSLRVWLGQGDGTFRQGPSPGGWKDVRSLDVGDLNGDDISDIALADYEKLSLIFGYGGGTFAGESIIYGDQYKGYRYDGLSLATADFNRDGNQDIVVGMNRPSPQGGYFYGENKIAIYWGTGYNTFKQGPIIDAPYSGEKVEVRDFNEDGLPDIAFNGWEQNNKGISIYLNKGDGTFGERIIYSDRGVGRYYPIFEDVNRDSHLDIVTAEMEETKINEGNYVASYSISIHTGNGDGTFQRLQTIQSEANPVSIVPGDFNGDGYLDLAVAKHYFEASSWSTGGWTLGLDVKRDDYIVEIWTNKGDGTFNALTAYALGESAYSIIAGDFNQDNKIDLTIRNGGSIISFFAGNGDGTFKPAVDYAGRDGAIISRDFNLDGLPDLAISSGNIQIILNTLPPLHTTPSPPKRLAGKPGDGAVSLSWAANAETDIAGYNTYRSLSAGGGYVKINNSPGTSLSYTDNTATNGITYYYTVSAVDKDGDESSYAVKVKITPNPPDTTPPVVKITTPVNSGTVYSPNLFILGTINEMDAKITVNDISGTIQKNDSTFTAYDIPLSAGENTITVTAVDAAGNSSTDSIKITYVPTASISGVVGDELTGQPVQWASVYVTDSEKTQNLSTGADGRYFFGRLIPGEVTIKAWAHDTDTLIISKIFSSGENLNLDLLLPLYPATLRGGVYNSSNYGGIAGATVTVTDRKKTQSVTTYNWGGFEVTNISPYDVTITVSKPGYETYTETRTLSNRWTNWRYYYLKALPPSAPTGLAAMPGGGYITLAWNQSPEDLLGYNIYRSTTPGSGYTKINSYPEYYTSYIDTNVAPATTYYYVITAVNTSQMESGYSAEASAMPRNVYSPTGLTAAAGEGFVELNWSPSSDSDISYYKIYRSTASGTGYVYFANAWETYYKDKDVTGGTTYYYVVTAVNTLSKESSYSNEASATPTAPQLSISITSPMDGTSAYASSVLLTGTIETVSPEVGIVIETTANKTTTNRQLANVNGNRFAAIVPLREGINMIKAIAKDSEGNQAEALITVFASMTQEAIKLTANPESGVLTTKADKTTRFDTTLKAEVYLPTPVLSYSWDFDGNGRSEQPGTLPEITTSYHSPGIYYPTVTVTDAKGNTYTATTVVNVMSKEQIDVLLKAKWEGMKGALGSGDIATTLNYFTASSKGKYSEVFTTLKDYLPSIAANVRDINLVSVTGDVAEYRISRMEDIDGKSMEITYFIYFTKDGDGLWRIESF